MRVAWVLIVMVALVGCTHPTPTPIVVTVPPPPDGGGFGVCHSPAAEQLAVPFRSTALNDSGGRDVGWYRLSTTSFVYVWAHENDTLRQDRVSRVNSVDVFEEPDHAHPLDVCTSIDVAAPQQVDGTRRTYDVAVRLDATDGLPSSTAGVRVLVDWTVGCSCTPTPRGNATATFGP